MPSVAEGVKLGIQECQHQFRGRRWNCTTIHDSLAIFGPVLDKGTPTSGSFNRRAPRPTGTTLTSPWRGGVWAALRCGDGAIGGWGSVGGTRDLSWYPGSHRVPSWQAQRVARPQALMWTFVTPCTPRVCKVLCKCSFGVGGGHCSLVVPLPRRKPTSP